MLHFSIAIQHFQLINWNFPQRQSHVGGSGGTMSDWEESGEGGGRSWNLKAQASNIPLSTP